MNPAQFAQKLVRKVAGRGREFIDEGKYRQIARQYNENGYKRIYLVHIRKTGGTSLNNMFLSLSGKDPKALYAQLAKTPAHRMLINGLIYVGWNVRCINKGNYYYGFSHTPLYNLDLPKETFTVSCFRDPVKRVVSHYNMLMDLHANNINHPYMATELRWLGESFNDFLQNIPQEHLLNQLYMFSRHFDIEEAVRNVNSLSHYFFSDQFDSGIDELNGKTGLNLKSIHIRKATYHAKISKGDMAILRGMLNNEYKFLDRVRELKIT